MTTRKTLLQISGLSTRYGPVEALRSVSLRVDQGQMVAVIGRNGAGKSTLMRSICGLEKPASGTIVFDGKRIDGQPAHRTLRNGVAYVPEGRRVFGTMSVADNLRIGAFTKFEGGQAKAREVPRLLDRVYAIFPVLAERGNQLAGTLSGGQQQMLAIGRALMSEPRLLLLDEPSMGLAPVVFHALFDTVKQLNAEGLTILVVEQKAYLTLQMVDYAYVLNMGAVSLSGDGPLLMANPEIRAAYLGGGSADTSPAPTASIPVSASEQPQETPMPTSSGGRMPPRPDMPKVVHDLGQRREALIGKLEERFRARARSPAAAPPAPRPPAASVEPLRQPAPVPPRIRAGLSVEQRFTANHRAKKPS